MDPEIGSGLPVYVPQVTVGTVSLKTGGMQTELQAQK